MTKAFQEAGIHTKERKVRGKRATKVSHKREEELLTQAEDLTCFNKVDKATRFDLADSLREL